MQVPHPPRLRFASKTFLSLTEFRLNFCLGIFADFFTALPPYLCVELNNRQIAETKRRHFCVCVAHKYFSNIFRFEFDPCRFSFFCTSGSRFYASIVVCHMQLAIWKIWCRCWWCCWLPLPSVLQKITQFQTSLKAFLWQKFCLGFVVVVWFTNRFKIDYLFLTK